MITPYGNNHWNGKEKIDISKEKDDAVILEISAKGKRAIQLKEKNEFEQDIVQVDKSAIIPEMVVAFVSPGMAIISRPTEHTQVIASNFSREIAPASTALIIP